MSTQSEDMVGAGLIGTLDQYGSAAVEVAGIVGSYYKALLAAGVPCRLTGSLVSDWHEMMWAKWLGIAVEEG